MTGAADPAGRKPVSKTVFLERQGYRQRRMMDLARLLPVTGAALWLVPLLWPGGFETAEGVAPVRTSQAVIYIFGVWALLIVAAALFGWGLRRWSAGEDADAPGPG